MNEPKRRGRPPKAKLLERAVEAITPENVHPEYINGDESREPEDVLPVKVDLTDAPAAGIALAVDAEVIGVSLAQLYALRVWSGQSPDVPRNERLKRVAKALEGQGLSMEGVVL